MIDRRYRQTCQGRTKAACESGRMDGEIAHDKRVRELLEKQNLLEE